MKFNEGDKAIVDFKSAIHNFDRYDIITIDSKFYGSAYWIKEDFSVPVHESGLVPYNKFTGHLYAISDN